MNLNILNEILKNEPSYRSKQIKRVLFVDLIESWDEATTLPKNLQDKLKTEFPISISKELSISKDNQTAKVLIKFDDGEKIESVIIRHNDGRNTICLSSQAGCPLACEFCATGKLGFKRDLTSSEIIIQFLFFARLFKKSEEKITNIVFMGMGEPFLNYDNVLEAIRIINDKDGLNIGARKISISTVGIIEGIEKLAEEKLQVNLAISLHASNDDLRSKIMPINKKYPLDKIFSVVDDYIRKTGRRVMFEYIMINGVNDSIDDALALAELMRKKLYFVNLISYNPTGIFKPSSGMRIKTFKEILTSNGVNVTQRYKFGDNIDAACGQLAGKNK